MNKIIALLLIVALTVCSCTYSITTHPDGSQTETFAAGVPVGDPWLGDGSPWLYYNNNWFYQGIPYFWYTGYGWWPYGTYQDVYIVRNPKWYGGHWNNYYHNHPNYVNQYRGRWGNANKNYINGRPHMTHQPGTPQGHRQGYQGQVGYKGAPQVHPSQTNTHPVAQPRAPVQKQQQKGSSAPKKK